MVDSLTSKGWRIWGALVALKGIVPNLRNGPVQNSVPEPILEVPSPNSPGLHPIPYSLYFVHCIVFHIPYTLSWVHLSSWIQQDPAGSSQIQLDPARSAGSGQIWLDLDGSGWLQPRPREVS